MHNTTNLHTQQDPNLHDLQFCVGDASPLSE